MFENAVIAYKNGDLETLRIIDEMVREPILPEAKQDAMAQLIREKERFVKLLENIKDSIARIKSEYPYTVKDSVYDNGKMAARKAELEGILRQYNELIETYSARIQKMLG
ncbi:hypothetical protein [Bacillus sp. 1P06AnD]|uniref:hypothetical protein n=1 Tax=Bacillus sp. 1P06AnD TaxID=3132208 RepID=UPI0039A0DFF4